jgi:glutaminyl-peptide cyclotransferase
MVRTGVGATGLTCLLLACSGNANNQMAAMPVAAPGQQQADQVSLPSGESRPSPLAAASAQTSAQGAVSLTFDDSRAYEHLRRQVGFGPRPAGSAALARTREYILGELAAIGVEAREDAFEATTPLGAVQMVNVIATIPGRRAERIALATHYDTKLFREFRFVGASDAASSTAAVLELARVLAGREHEFTIELLFFDGEEAVVDWFRNNDNTYGSRRYVQTAQEDGSLDGLKALVLLDMIGDRNLTIRRDSNSTPWLTDIVWASAATLGHQGYFLDQRVNIEDDHVPFLRAGIPSVDIIDLDYPAWHTAQDDLAHVSARSLQVVGDVVLDAWPRIEQHLSGAQ